MAAREPSENETAALRDALARREAQLRDVTSRYRGAVTSNRYRLGDLLLSLPHRRGIDTLRHLRKLAGAAGDKLVRVVRLELGRLNSPRSTAPAPTSRPAPARPDLTVAAVLDEFSAAGFAYECRLVDVRRRGWRQLLEHARPSFLLVESAWRGAGETWRGQVQHAALTSGALQHLLQWCNRRGIPTVFWNKEDPAHFHRFIDAAAMFRLVFTTDADCIPTYRILLGHDRIWPLPFAAQPKLHHPPVNDDERTHEVAFAGSWNVCDHAGREAGLRMLLDAAKPFGLDIFDRNHGTSRAGAYTFPREYSENVRGRLSYREMVDAYRRYKVFLNVDSIVGSPSMCSRRVFELLASGTVVISTPSRAISELIGDDVVQVVETPKQARQTLRRLLGDDGERRRLSAAGIERVLAAHTVGHRLDAILERIGT